MGGNRIGSWESIFFWNSSVIDLTGSIRSCRLPLLADDDEIPVFVLVEFKVVFGDCDSTFEVL